MAGARVVFSYSVQIRCANSSDNKTKK